MTEFIIFIIVAVVLYFFIKNLRAQKKNSNASSDAFAQAGVLIEFKTGKLKIGKYVYNVNQVTGVSAQPFGRNILGKYDDRNWHAVIEVDDFNKPRHLISFYSNNSAQEFTQRVCIALRKAGGPSFT